MPCSHHRHNLSQHNQCCCCCCCSSCCSSHSHSSNSSPTPLLTTSDHLLQALAAQILLQSPSHPPLKSLHHPPLFQDHLHGDAHLHDQQHQQHQQQLQTHSLIHSLLRRVSTLESSFTHLSSAPPPFHSSPAKHQQRRPSTPPPPPRSTFSSSSVPSLRDLAARRIQAAFRRFLLRRSQTLRHLKDLAAMKSHVASLRCALSDKVHVDPQALSERAMYMLFRLDAIQSSELMIREGKRAISRELTRILEFIDKVLVKEDHLPLDAIDITGSGGNERYLADDRTRGSERAEEIVRHAKKVSFLEDGRRPRVSFSNVSQFAEELNNSTNQNFVVENLSEEVMSNGTRDYIGAERFHEVSDDERSSESSLDNSGRLEKAKQFQKRNGKLGLTAPLPVQMEPRRK